MKRILTLWTVLRNSGLLLLGACLSAQDVSQQEPKTEIYAVAEAYEAYSALLAARIPSGPNRATVLIRYETYPGVSPFCSMPRSAPKGFSGTANDNFLSVNRHKWQLQDRFKIPAKYELLSDEHYSAIVQSIPDAKTDPEAIWRKLKQLYPGFTGIAGFSAIGFNADKTVAALYMSWNCGSLCGVGAVYVLRKKNGAWHILEDRKVECWAS